MKINTGSGYYGDLQFAAGTWNVYGGRTHSSQHHRAKRRDASYQSWGVTTKKASNSTKKIANKAAPKKYSASPSSKTVRVKRCETLSKIARRHHVNGGWKCLCKQNKETIKNPNSIFIGQAVKIK